MTVDQSKPERGTQLVVFGSIALLAGIFVLTVAAYMACREWALMSSAAVLSTGAIAFVAAVLALSFFGAQHIRVLAQLGLSDPLTNLPNRRALHADLREELGNRREVALALLDLDGFKLVNDHYGHLVGDATIRKIARVLAEITDKEAKIYRLGGDEYAMMIAGEVAGTLLEGLSRRVIDRMANPIIVDDHRLSLGVSIGLVRCPADGDLGSSELLRQADVALSVSKRGGKMRCTWFNRAFDQSREEVKKLDDDLRVALSNDEFRVHYQPLVNSQSRRVVAVESLLRWERPDGKQVGPNVFIPVAEQSGLINAIGLWVIRQACRDALGWSKITLSINISAAQLRNPEFPVQLGHILEETGFDPERLELEITETCLVLDPVVAERSLAVIRSFGVRIALDDFGTGYASIGFLRQFRFEKLKLDRSLVVQASEDAGSRAMMLSSIAVARAMEMGVTAEGVETQEQADMMRAAGCDQIQGWLYFKALPAEEISQHLGKPVLAASDREKSRESRVA